MLPPCRSQTQFPRRDHATPGSHCSILGIDSDPTLARSIAGLGIGETAMHRLLPSVFKGQRTSGPANQVRSFKQNACDRLEAFVLVEQFDDPGEIFERCRGAGIETGHVVLEAEIAEGGDLFGHLLG